MPHYICGCLLFWDKSFLFLLSERVEHPFIFVHVNLWTSAICLFKSVSQSSLSISSSLSQIINLCLYQFSSNVIHVFLTPGVVSEFHGTGALRSTYSCRSSSFRGEVRSNFAKYYWNCFFPLLWRTPLKFSWILNHAVF